MGTTNHQRRNEPRNGVSPGSVFAPAVSPAVAGRKVPLQKRGPVAARTVVDRFWLSQPSGELTRAGGLIGLGPATDGAAWWDVSLAPVLIAGSAKPRSQHRNDDCRE